MGTENPAFAVSTSTASAPPASRVAARRVAVPAAAAPVGSLRRTAGPRAVIAAGAVAICAAGVGLTTELVRSR